MTLKIRAATEIAQLFAHHPTSEQIVAFHPSPEVAERAYELIQTEREGTLTEVERQELESYLVIEYLWSRSNWRPTDNEDSRHHQECHGAEQKVARTGTGGYSALNRLCRTFTSSGCLLREKDLFAMNIG